MTYEKENQQLRLQIVDSDLEEAPRGNDEAIRDDDESSAFILRLPLFQWKSFLVFLGISLGLLLHWFATSELFEIPPDVIETRQQFIQAKENYFSNEVYWDTKLRHFMDVIQEEMNSQNEYAVIQRLQETPGEIFLSFLEKRMHLTLVRLKETAVFPKEGSTFSVVVSKHEGGIWPLKIMLSMEIEIKCRAQRFSLAISRL